MSVQARLESLGKRHQALEDQLSEVLRHPAADNLEIHAIKRQKLAIKDEMSALETVQESDA